jgi:hypothetical protein
VDVCFFLLVYVYRGFDGKLTFFVNEISLEKFLRMTGLLMFLKMVNNAIVCRCPCFSVLYVRRRLNGKCFSVNGIIFLEKVF